MNRTVKITFIHACTYGDTPYEPTDELVLLLKDATKLVNDKLAVITEVHEKEYLEATPEEEIL